MANISRKSGEEVVKGYEEYAQTPHGRLRHDLLFHHYASFLSRNPVHSMLDMGAGSGLLVARLLQSFPAMKFLLVDDDPAMIRAAKDRLAALGAADRWEVVSGSHGDLPRLFTEWASFAQPYLISFNHVIEYVEDQEGALRGLANSIAPGSHLGVMYLNNSHEALRRVWHKDSVKGLLTQLQTGAFDAVNFGMARAILPERLHAAVTGAGLVQTEEFGLRCFSEWKSKEFVETQYPEVLAAEEKVGTHSDFLGLARYRLRFYRRPGA